MKNGMFPHQKSFLFINTIDIVSYLGFVVLSIRNFGWISKRKKKMMAPWTESTSDIALKIMQSGAKVESKDWEESWSALTWARDRFSNRDNLSSYERSLADCIAANKISINEIGIVASLISYYRTNRWASDDSQHVGSVGERSMFHHLFVASVVHYDSGYGTVYSYVLLDENKNLLIWRTSKILEVGKIYHGRCTVKDHNTFGSTNRTSLTRCRLECD